MLTRKQAAAIYTAFFHENAVGVDSEGNPITNPTPATTLALQYDLPFYLSAAHVPHPIQIERDKKAITFLRAMADAIEEPHVSA